MKISTKIAELTAIIEPAVNACGVDLWGIEFGRQGHKSLLCVYIDKKGDDGTDADGSPMQSGVSIEDCTRVTHQVGGVLEVHDPISGEYILEVSSPGVDKPIFRREQFAKFIGQRVALRLIDAVRFEGQMCRKLSGILQRIEPNGVIIDGHLIDFENIDKANLIYQF